jgi:hypothetical protein
VRSSVGDGGHLVPGAAFEEATVAFLKDATPLLEVEGDAGL